MRVIPERAGRMIRWDVILVLELDTGWECQEDIVAIAGRTDPKAVRVQVGRVDPYSPYGALFW